MGENKKYASAESSKRSNINEQIQRRATKIVKTDKNLVQAQAEGRGRTLSSRENGAVGGSIVQQALKEFYENHPEVRKGKTWERRNRLREEALRQSDRNQ